MNVGILHPGEMGAAIAAGLRTRGHTVVWASADRSAATAERARSAGLEDVGSVENVAQRSDVILSVCPPHAAGDVSQAATAFDGIFVDANAIAPETSRAIGAGRTRFVDGGIIGPPPLSPGTTRASTFPATKPRTSPRSSAAQQSRRASFLIESATPRR